MVRVGGPVIIYWGMGMGTQVMEDAIASLAVVGLLVAMPFRYNFLGEKKHGLSKKPVNNRTLTNPKLSGG